SMRYSPRNIEIAISHAGLTLYGGILFFNEFSRMLQLRRFLTRHLRYPRRNQDYLLQRFIHQPDHRSRLILDLDSTVVTVFGHQEGAAVGYNPRYRGKRSFD